jgi:hypothetical protein
VYLTHRFLVASIGLPFSSHTCRQPLRALECRAEEEAFLACKPTADNGMCAAPVREYVQCADRVTFRLMNPSTQGAKLR